MLQFINQSFICDMRDYIAGGSCGKIIEAKYIQRRLLEDHSRAMRVGMYFEFCLAGAVPKSGIPPQPEYMPSALKRNKGSVVGLGHWDMLSPYRKASDDAKVIRGYLDAWGLKIVHIGKTLTKGRFRGTIDLIVQCTRNLNFVDHNGHSVILKAGDKFVIDLKYSGLLYDRWEKFGWAWSNIQKEFHGTQAKQYHYISDLPFMFWVTKPAGEEGDTPDCKIFFVPITAEMIENHIAEANQLNEQLEFHATKMGFVARPSMKKCADCVLFDECDSKHTFPHPEVIDLNFT